MSSELVATIKEFLIPSRYVRRSIPPLDGGLTPNDRLDEVTGAILQGFEEPDDVLVAGDGGAYITSGDEIVSIDRSGARKILATLPGQAGPLAPHPAGGLLVGVAGHGLLWVTAESDVVPVLEMVDGESLLCPTDIAVHGAQIYLTDGSTEHHGDEWVHDLMAQNNCGRLVHFDTSSGRARVLRNGMAYPSGITVSRDGTSLIVSEAWAHRILAIDVGNAESTTVLRDNLPGYPGRLSTSEDGSYWLAVFALRTQLVDFVLTQRDFIDEMVNTIEPDLWVRPALRSLNSGLEPLQGGQIRKLGVVKPWAPPRSYGLVARLDHDGNIIDSWHSRAGGQRHGVTAVRPVGSRLAIAIRGGREVVITDWSSQ